MAVTALLFQMPRYKFGMRSEGAMSDTIEEYNSGGMKFASAAKEFVVTRNNFRQKSNRGQQKPSGIYEYVKFRLGIWK
jgi:hypothetical protein